MTWLRRLFPCAACEVREQIHLRELSARDEEVRRYDEREKALLKEIHDLTNKLSAHADATAHVAAVRAEAELTSGGRASHRTQPVSSRIPPFANALARGRHLRVQEFRMRGQERVVLDPAQRPVTAEEEGAGSDG